MTKLLIGLAALGIATGVANNAAAPTANTSNVLKVDMSINNPNTLKVVNEELDWLSKAILEKGADFMKSGLSSLATYAFKTACMEMGIDVRDATTKKIDQIIAQLDKISNQIQQGFDDLTKKAQQVEDRGVMNDVLKLINQVKTPVYSEMKTLEVIAQREQEEGYDQEFLEEQKENFINGFKTKLNFYGLSNEVWHSTELLAYALAAPNPSKPSQSLMDLYDNTLGANDIWDYQSYAPRVQFVQQCSFLLNSLALLSKLDAAKEISQYKPGDANIEGIQNSIDNMCKAVNIVNGIFQKELEKLSEIKARHDDEICPTMSHLKRTFDKDGYVHITTDYTVSAYLATITISDVTYQNTCADYYNDGYSHCFKSFKAEDDFYTMILNDYSFYVNTYKVDEDYNFKVYLRDLGFRIPEYRQSAFDEAIGLYKDVQVKRVDRGVFWGADYYSYYNYYDWKGNQASNNISRVGETFWKNYDDEYHYADNIAAKMIAFVNADNQHLLGSTLYTIAHRNNDATSKLINHFYRGSKSNDTNYADYKVIQ